MPLFEWLAQDPHQCDSIGAAWKRRSTETAEEMVVRQGPVRRRDRQQGLSVSLSSATLVKFYSINVTRQLFRIALSCRKNVKITLRTECHNLISKASEKCFDA